MLAVVPAVALLLGATAPVLTLDDALKEARTRNVDLRIAQTKLDQARQLSAKVWANYLPQLGLGGAYTYNSAEAILKLPQDRELTIADLATIPKEFYSVERVSIPDAEPLANELAGFVECAKAKREPEVPGEHGVRAMRAAERILAEMRAHRWR